MQNFIDGQFQATTSTPLDMVMAIRAANKALILWRKTTHQERQIWLKQITTALASHQDELIILSATESHLPTWAAKEWDVQRAIEIFQYYATHEAPPHDETFRHIATEPIGCVGVITSWSLSLYQLARAIAPALLCGNTVVVKPSSRAPDVAQFLAKLCADLPKGILNFVFGPGAEVGELLASHPGVQVISFTGKSQTGKRVVELAAPELKRVQLNLSSKNAALVLDDADFAQVTHILARAAFVGLGQNPFGISRIMVSEKEHDRFVARFKEAMTQLKAEDLAEVAQPEKLNEVLTRARNEKAEVWSPPAQPSAQLITGLHNCSELQQEEIANPVVIIVPYKAVHEGVKWINTTPYGTCACVFSADGERALKIAGQLAVATVWINGWNKFDPDLPHGGAKQSGLGRLGGEWATDFFSETKSVYVCSLTV